MRSNWYILTSAALVAGFVATLAIVLLAFGRVEETLYLMLVSLAFLPLQALVVTLFIDRLLETREKEELGQRVNIVIEVFFTEMGIELLRYLTRFDRQLDDMRKIASVTQDWTSRDFSHMRKRLQSYAYNIDCHCAELSDLKSLLQDKHDFLPDLLSNSALLEHQTFTKLLWGILHLARELDSRPNVDDLPDADYKHLGDDMRRVYIELVSEWLSFAQRLKANQPYSFSLAVRLNPFVEKPSAVVED